MDKQHEQGDDRARQEYQVTGGPLIALAGGAGRRHRQLGCDATRVSNVKDRRRAGAN
ncbi:hypothetical protein [Rhodoluna limnophila]|uniref:hypothetical protein n=1 Tax=Rhodoluna limnophila TaxID=232537 RepID=UPI001562626D|nr:hypothetical protein [Rhodoluna limnophila]